MARTVNVNGVPIQYPQTGDPNWGDNATNFAIQTSAALGKLGLSSGTSVDITQTLDVTGNTTLDANLSVGGNTTLDANLSVGGTTSLTGNVTLTNNLTVNGNTQLGNANTDTIGVTGIVNVNAGTLYVNPVNNRVGIVNSSPSKALDVTGEIQSSSHITCNGVVYADDDTTANTPVISFIGDTNTGIGRSASDTLDFITNGNSRFRIESTGQLQAVVSGNTTLYPGYLCRAWVNFNGTGTTGQNQTIRGSGNVSSVLKNATGNYTVNIDVDMPDANYTCLATTIQQASGAGNINSVGYHTNNSVDPSNYLAGSVTLSVKAAGGGDTLLRDATFISVGIFR